MILLLPVEHYDIIVLLISISVVHQHQPRYQNLYLTQNGGAPYDSYNKRVALVTIISSMQGAILQNKQSKPFS